MEEYKIVDGWIVPKGKEQAFKRVDNHFNKSEMNNAK